MAPMNLWQQAFHAAKKTSDTKSRRNAAFSAVASVLMACALALALRLAASPKPSSPVHAQAQALRTVPLRYRLTDLGTLPGADSSEAFGLDGQGNVVGTTSHLMGYVSVPLHPFQYRNGQMHDLGLLPGMTGGYALSVNQRGAVVGEMDRLTTSDPFRKRAFVWRDGALMGLDVPQGYGDSEAKGINDKSQVVGSLLDAKSRSMAFLRQDGRMRALGSLRGYGFSVATAVNNRGQVAGYVEGSSDTGEPAEAFLYDHRRMRGLGWLGGNYSHADGLSDDGQVVGDSTTGRHDRHSNEISHPFLWRRGRKMLDLGSFGGTYGEAYGINHQGQVVGAATRADGHYHAFLWQRGALFDLNGLIPSGSGWFLAEAHAINDRGQIAGTGVVNGHERAFLLTPQ